MDFNKITIKRVWFKQLLMGVLCAAICWLDQELAQPVQEGQVLCFWGAVLGGVLSLVGSGIGAHMSSKASKEAVNAYDAAWGNISKYYQNELNTSILDRADTLSMLRTYRKNQEENARKFNNNAIKGGASEEAKVAYAQQANEGYADAISKISAYGAQRRDALSQQYAKAQFDYATNRANMQLQGQQNVANAITQGFGAIGDIFGSINWGKK